MFGDCFQLGYNLASWYLGRTCKIGSTITMAGLEQEIATLQRSLGLLHIPRLTNVDDFPAYWQTVMGDVRRNLGERPALALEVGFRLAGVLSFIDADEMSDHLKQVREKAEVLGLQLDRFNLHPPKDIADFKAMMNELHVAILQLERDEFGSHKESRGKLIFRGLLKGIPYIGNALDAWLFGKEK
ncbi:MAG: hypothetical protein DRG39_04110 [Deltaproteobacteria bacterium]|nr:MAG: hypothetical protein DRG39_04110 [Deltaproteobacteria bacterium]